MIVLLDNVLQAYSDPVLLFFHYMMYISHQINSFELLSTTDSTIQQYLTSLNSDGDYISGKIGPKNFRYTLWKGKRYGPAFCANNEKLGDFTSLSSETKTNNTAPHNTNNVDHPLDSREHITMSRKITGSEIPSSIVISYKTRVVPIFGGTESEKERFLVLWKILNESQAHFKLPHEIGIDPIKRLIRTLKSSIKHSPKVTYAVEYYNPYWILDYFIATEEQEKAVKELINTIIQNNQLFPLVSISYIISSFQYDILKIKCSRFLKDSMPLSEFARYCVLVRHNIFTLYPGSRKDMLLFWNKVWTEWSNSSDEERSKKMLGSGGVHKSWADDDEFKLFVASSDDSEEDMDWFSEHSFAVSIANGSQEGGLELIKESESEDTVGQSNEIEQLSDGCKVIVPNVSDKAAVISENSATTDQISVLAVELDEIEIPTSRGSNINEDLIFDNAYCNTYRNLSSEETVVSVEGKENGDNKTTLCIDDKMNQSNNSPSELAYEIEELPKENGETYNNYGTIQHVEIFNEELSINNENNCQRTTGNEMNNEQNTYESNDTKIAKENNKAATAEHGQSLEETSENVEEPITSTPAAENVNTSLEEDQMTPSLQAGFEHFNTHVEADYSDIDHSETLIGATNIDEMEKETFDIVEETVPNTNITGEDIIPAYEPHSEDTNSAQSLQTDETKHNIEETVSIDTKLYREPGALAAFLDESSSSECSSPGNSEIAGDYLLSPLRRNDSRDDTLPNKIDMYEKLSGYIPKHRQLHHGIHDELAAEKGDITENVKHTLKPVVKRADNGIVLELKEFIENKPELISLRSVKEFENSKRADKAKVSVRKGRSISEIFSALLDDNMKDLSVSAEYKNKIVRPQDLYNRIKIDTDKPWDKLSRRTKERYYGAFLRQYDDALNRPENVLIDVVDILEIVKVCVEFGDVQHKIVQYAITIVESEDELSSRQNSGGAGNDSDGASIKSFHSRKSYGNLQNMVNNQFVSSINMQRGVSSSSINSLRGIRVFTPEE